MQRQFVDLTLRSCCEVFIDIVEIQAIAADDTGAKVFIKGSDDPFRVRENPYRIFEKMKFQKEKDE